MKKIYVLLAAVCCMVMSHAQDTSGSCGDHLTWEYDTETNVLTITGWGAMTNFNTSPWSSYRRVLTTVVFDGEITSIGRNAFKACEKLNEITLPSSVITLRENAFISCSAVSSITCYALIPPTVSSGAFDGISTDIPIFIPEGTMLAYSDATGWGSFNDFHEMEGETLFEGACGETMTWVLDLTTGELTLNGGGAMDNYDEDAPAPWYTYRASIFSVNTWDQPTTIGNYAFYECTNLRNVTLSSTITLIGSHAFDGCRSLAEINLPMELKTILMHAFYGCSALQSIYIPMEVNDISSYAFRESGIEEFEVSENNEHFCAVSQVLFTKDMTILKAYPIANPRTEYKVPEGVMKIEDGAFYRAVHLEMVDLPESLSEIGNLAFGMCTGYTSVTCRAVTPPSLGVSAFTTTTSDMVPLYVPEGSVEDYANSDWNKYFGIFHEIAPEGIEAVNGERSERSEKVLREGTLYILRGDKTYTPQGQEVK